jgi:hypothetical protein
MRKRSSQTLGRLCLLTFAWALSSAVETNDARASDKTLRSTQYGKHLLLDERMVEHAENASLVLGKVRKHPANPLFREDRPWEPRGDNYYCNVLYDREERLYKCWYNPFVTSELDEKTPRAARGGVKWRVSPRLFGLCYATSPDGIGWHKPSLGLVAFRGSKENNILMFEVHGPGIVKDMNEQDAKRRYKMIGAVGGLGPHRVWYSPDGLHWGEPTIHANIGGRSDTRNNVLWVPERKEWMLVSRVGFMPRDIGRSASPDFDRWSPIELVLKPEPGQPHFHDMVAFRDAGIYLGLIGVFDTVADRQWVELAWSPDSLRWHRVLAGVPFIPNGQTKGDYDWGCVFADRPIVGETEVRIYYSAGNGCFHDWRDASLCLATLGKDRWAGYRALDHKTGSILTRPLPCRGGTLTISADAQGGSLRVVVLSDTGEELAHPAPITSNVTDHIVADLTAFVGRTVRLRFELDRATLYAFAFARSQYATGNVTPQ